MPNLLHHQAIPQLLAPAAHGSLQPRLAQRVQALHRPAAADEHPRGVRGMGAAAVSRGLLPRRLLPQRRAAAQAAALATRLPWHAGKSCARVSKASEREICRIARRCPRCATPIEIRGGCAHMCCVVCEFEFCYDCGYPWLLWLRDGGVHPCRERAARIAWLEQQDDEEEEEEEEEMKGITTAA
ncbi:hypothetical protein FN846DRAFT_78444 [Sphaerosporella brunnea]|uniref:Uncharacterized protein n=1 Tax=Sphaerosporella brunnea TaxID=1250544 RepID=A0A5J5F8P8_9PEZI|nr:hypothetical protein FN846DRAFT_78444 [Sphaerosporella brunnea]